MHWHIYADIVSLLVVCVLYVYNKKMLSGNSVTYRDKLFFGCLGIGAFVSVIDIAAGLVTEYSAGKPVYHAVMVLYYVSMQLIIIGWIYYAAAIIYENDKKRMKAVTGLMWVLLIPYLILIVSNPWMGLLYTLDSAGVYSRGRLFALSIVLYALYAVVLFVLVLIKRKAISKEYPMCVLLFIPMAATISIAVQLLVPEQTTVLSANMLCLVLTTLFMQNARISNDQEVVGKLTELVDNFSSGLAIWTITTDKKNVLRYISKGFSDICEEDNDSLTKRFSENMFTGVHPDDLELVRDSVINFEQESEHKEIIFRFITVTGKIKWLNISTKFEYNSDGSVTCYSTYTDLTKQKQLYQKLSDIVHNVPCTICLFNWDGERLKPLMVNKRFSEMLGEDAFTYLDNTVDFNFSHVHPNDIDKLKCIVQKALNNSEEIEATYRSLNNTTGKYLWIHMRGIVIPQNDGTKYVYSGFYDVTKEHLATQRLREGEQMLEYAARYAGLWYWRYNSATAKAYFDVKNQQEFGVPEVVENYPESWLSSGFIHKDDVALYRDSLAKIDAGEESVVIEVRVLLKDGTPHWARFRFNSTVDTSGKPTGVTICTGNIIDDEKQLRMRYEFEQNKPSLGEENLLVHSLFNLTTGETLEYVYRNGEAVPECDRTALMKNDANIDRLIVDAEERAVFRRNNAPDYLLECYAQGKTELRHDYRRVMLNGEVAWVRNILHLVSEPESGDIMLFVYFYNIDDEKLRELMNRSLAAENYDYVARINIRTKHFILFPKEGLSYRMPPLKGDDADAVTYEVYGDGIAEEDKENTIQNTLVKNIERNLEERGRFSFTYREIQPDGAVLYKKITQYYLDKDLGYVIMTREDVTELIRTEAERNSVLATALEAANQASKAKTHFLSRVSHELRTPLNAIIGFMELAKGADKKQMDEYLSNSDIAAKQLLSIINDVLDMSAIESGKLKLSRAPFDFKLLVNSITNIYLPQCEQKGIKFNTQLLSTVDEWLIGDKMRVNQVLLNLLNNSVKFTDSGEISLRISCENTEGNRVLIRFLITDTGCGMSEEMQKRLFKPFEQESASTALKYGGNGLGLSIVSNLVNMMGGSISVVSESGKGSAFTVDIPFTVTKNGVQEGNISGVERLRVLAVDDEQLEREYISIVLKRMGVRFTCVNTGNDALRELEKAQCENDEYNICLVDWKMPQMDGIETTKRIREKYGKDVIVIVISAYEHHQVDGSARDAGANLFVTKPLFQSSLNDLFVSLTGGSITKKAVPTDNRSFAGKRILLAEDNAMNRMVAQGLIDKLGAVCESAENGKIAADMFIASEPDYYDAILMDIQMPVMDGFEATKVIRESEHPRAKTVKIIALTANAFNEDVARSLASGMNDHVTKPIEPKLLFDALDRAFR